VSVDIRVMYPFYAVMCSQSHSQGWKRKATVQLPEDTRKLRDIYLEAEYYGLEEFQRGVCSTTGIVYAMSVR